MGTGMISAVVQNTEAQRTRSFASRLFSVISVPLCFKTSSAEHGYVLTPGRYARDDDKPSDLELAEELRRR